MTQSDIRVGDPEDGKVRYVDTDRELPDAWIEINDEYSVELGAWR